MKATRLAAACSSRPAARLRARASDGGGARELGDEAADRRAEFGRAADAVALPEGQPARLAECRGDEDPVVRDLLDAPARGPEREHVADPRLVDHLLVELTDAAARPGLADHEHAEQSPIGDRAATRHGEPLCASPADDRAGVAVPHEPARNSPNRSDG